MRRQAKLGPFVTMDWDALDTPIGVITGTLTIIGMVIAAALFVWQGWRSRYDWRPKITASQISQDYVPRPPGHAAPMPQILLTVRNVGPETVTVEQVTVVQPGGAMIVSRHGALSPSLQLALPVKDEVEPIFLDIATKPTGRATMSLRISVKVSTQRPMRRTATIAVNMKNVKLPAK